MGGQVDDGDTGNSLKVHTEYIPVMHGPYPVDTGFSISLFSPVRYSMGNIYTQ